MGLRGAACAQHLSPFMEIWMSPFTRIACLRSVVRGAATACAMLASAAASAGEAVQWRVEDGGNGHWYEVSSDVSTWPAARDACVARGGMLACCETAAECNFLRGRYPAETAFIFVGLFQDLSAPEYSEPSGGWKWLSGAPFDSSLWQPGEPNNYFGDERFGELEGPGRPPFLNDVIPGGTLRHFVEWSADCNNDGVVDYGQILLGQLADTNANGVPDACEAIRVPQDYPTIQAAIDAVGPGTPRIVAVAPGTYNEAFSLNGKDVVVRGAPNDSTILDGAGLATSIARFAGGEPATAGVENLVFRNGTAGSRLYEGAKFTVGGALFGADSAAFIRGCRFEQNRADFGGAVYLIRSEANMLDCMFTGNTGRTDGGGAMLYECEGSVRASDFIGNACATAGSGNGGAFKSVGGRTEGAIVTLEGCGVASTSSGSDGAAVHHFENLGFGVSGVLRIVDSNITGNSTVVGAAGLSVDGRQSACVLAGSTAICANTPRNVEGAYLIEGAVTVCDCLADLTGDGSVDGADLGILLNSWGLANAQGDGDVNHDGAVNGADLGALLSSWGGCPG